MIFIFEEYILTILCMYMYMYMYMYRYIIVHINIYIYIMYIGSPNLGPTLGSNPESLE